MSYKSKKKKVAQPISLKSIVLTEHVFDLDDELDMLLETHLQNKKSKEFAQQRLSIISLSSNGSRNSNNNLAIDNVNTLIDRTRLSVPSSSSPKVDQLSDLKTRLLTLQNVLQYLPDDIRTLRKQNTNDIDLLEPIYSSFLVVVGSNIQTEQRYFCELVDNILYLRREPHSKVKQAITISFIQSNALNTDYLTNPKNKPSNKGSKSTGPSVLYFYRNACVYLYVLQNRENIPVCFWLIWNHIPPTIRSRYSLHQAYMCCLHPQKEIK